MLEALRERPSTTEEQDDRIVEKVTAEPLKPVTQHQKELEAEGIIVSENIMRERLKKAGYYCYKARKKPWIFQKNRAMGSRKSELDQCPMEQSHEVR